MREALEKLENGDPNTARPLKDQLFDYELQLADQDDKNRNGSSLPEDLILCSSCGEFPKDPVEGKVGDIPRPYRREPIGANIS